MSGYRLSRRAVADLSAIWDDTAERWGADQAERYLTEIRRGCQVLGSGLQGGRDASQIRKGYRSLLAGSHVLFFRTSSNGGIEIVRILHQRMDAPRRL